MASVAEQIEHRRLHEVRLCVVPRCPERARAAFYVSGPLRLAGRDWTVGEFVDLCPEHEHELRSVAALDSPELLAPFREWDCPACPRSVTPVLHNGGHDGASA